MAAPTRIRPATIKDLDSLERLEQASFLVDAFGRDQLRYFLTRAKGTSLVLEHEGEVAGAALIAWRRNSPVGRLYSIATTPALRGRGFGSQLLKECEDEASRRGCTEVILEVRTDNDRAMAFYQRHGYSTVGTLAGVYSDGADALRMHKKLAR